jgi:hypothetical protein
MLSKIQRYSSVVCDTAEAVEIKFCKSCGLALEATRDNFYSAGTYKDKTYFKSTCKVCERKAAQARYEAQKALKNESAIQQAERLAQVRAKLTFTLYKKARDAHEKGSPERLQRLKDYIAAEQVLRMIQNALPAKQSTSAHEHGVIIGNITLHEREFEIGKDTSYN